MCESDNEGIAHLDVHDAMYMDVLITKPPCVFTISCSSFCENTHPSSNKMTVNTKLCWYFKACL